MTKNYVKELWIYHMSKLNHNIKEELEAKLVVGTKIKLGKEYCKESFCTELTDTVITLVDGSFEYENGLYIEMQSCPAVWNEKQKEFDSIYHLFGNNLEDFLDCEIVK